jgi:endonuclease/exonuclease/phosphatase (EEP) superfamily protein YafD
VRRLEGQATRTASHLLIAALVALGAATALALAAPLGWPFELFVHFRVQYATAAFLVAASLLVVGHPRASLLGLALASFNALPVLQRAHAGPPAAACAGSEFTVITANVQYANEDRRLFLDWLAAHPADLLVIQEVTAAWAGDLASLKDYSYRVLLAREDPYGIGVLSRWPLDAVEPEDFAADGLPSLAGRVRVAGRSLRFLAMHTRWPILPGLARARDRSLDSAASLLKAGDGPAVTLGDLNVTPFSPAYSNFLRETGLVDAVGSTRWQPTWMAGFWPLSLRIDHVFVSPGLCVEAAAVGTAIGSDHRPVLVRLRFATTG